MRTRNASSILAAAVIFGLLPGCGGAGGGKPVKVEGVVTLNGQPLDGATILFEPEGKWRSATGFTEKDGSFQMTTYNTNDGALPGTYKVVISKRSAGPGAPEGMPSGGDPEAMQKYMKEGGYQKIFKEMAKQQKLANKKGEIPQRFTNVSSTPLKITVPHEGKVTFDLKSE